MLTYVQRSAVAKLVSAYGGAAPLTAVAELLGVPLGRAETMCKGSGFLVAGGKVR